MYNISSLFVIALFLVSLPTSSNTSLSLQPSFHHFDYTEFDLLDLELDSETGWLPGITLEAKTDISPLLKATFQVAQYRNDLDYIGQTNSGIPLTTITDEEITLYVARLAYSLSTQTEIFGASRYSEWERDIRDSGSISGLFEIYRWWEISAGVRTVIGHVDSHTWFVEASLLHIEAPEIYVDLSRVNGGITTLNLGEEFGGRLQLESVQNTDKPWSFGLVYYVEFWDFGRSNTLATTGGTRQFIVTEPRSETRNFGFKLSFRYTFQ